MLGSHKQQNYGLANGECRLLSGLLLLVMLSPSNSHGIPICPWFTDLTHLTRDDHRVDDPVASETYVRFQ